MSTIPSVLLASELDVLGDSLFDTAAKWADRGLRVALAVLVLAGIARTFSFKAAIGALLAMIIALSIYSARDSLSGKVTDKINNPTTGAGAPTVVISPRPGWKAGPGPVAGNSL
ncbi:hypothetical protein [Streptomyces subrutilus]|uniref:Uncharacterized protein n=1 Tax=Streptomyces subrutilus TaxID=36818 RepID=A0A1E5PKA7_9ACTN|nr:hypothetical protein [Streptomyces subrutilus]OEJ29999.1 hypothetical protein BGK67_00070 [Streptomyces subrutilus]